MTAGFQDPSSETKWLAGPAWVTKASVRRFGLLSAGLILLSAAGPAQTRPTAAGHWEGTLQMPNRDLNITVDLAQGKAGKWIGSMSVLGSSSIDVPLGDITVKDTAVGFTATLPQTASFEGKLSADAESLTGKASNPDGEVDFQLARRGQANVKLPPPSSKFSKKFAGTWEATVEKDGTVKRLSLKLWPAPDGRAAGTLMTLEPRKMEFPITTVTMRNQQLELECRAVSGSYRGRLGGSGEIVGEWTERSARTPVTFKRVASEAKEK